MQIQSQKITKLNITAVFRKINHSRLSAEMMRNIFQLNKKDNSPFFEPSPDVKILLLPTEKKDALVEHNRLLINDYSGEKPTESSLIKYFKTAFDNLTDKSKITAYGFNYDLLIKSKNKINFKKFLGNTLLKSLLTTSILESGVRVLFDKAQLRYDLQIVPAGSPNNILIHINAHYSSKKINFQDLKKQFNKHYLELIKIIESI